MFDIVRESPTGDRVGWWGGGGYVCGVWGLVGGWVGGWVGGGGRGRGGARTTHMRMCDR